MRPVLIAIVTLLTPMLSVCGEGASVYRPVAATQLSDAIIAVANRDRGSVSIVDLRDGRVICEKRLGKQIVDVKLIGDNRLLAIDHSRHQLVVARYENDRCKIEQRVLVKPFPIAAAASDNNQWCAVTSLWSHQLTICRLAGEESSSGVEPAPQTLSLSLPMAPRCVLLLEDLKRIVIADAFGGKIVVVSYELDEESETPTSLKIDSVRTVPGHNIAHLAIYGKGHERRLYLTQMVLNRLAEPRQDEIHWGSYIASSLRSLSLTALVEPDARLIDGCKLRTLGDLGRGAADPSGFVIDSHDRRVIAMSGTDEVMAFDRYGKMQHRISVGAGPCSLLSIRGTEFVTINTYDDSVSVIDIPLASGKNSPRLIRTIPLSTSKPVLTKAQLGERHFRSAALSHDGWLSCHSCHTDGHTCGLNADTLGDGNPGAAKRILSLRGIDGTEPLAWNGTMTFESQVHKSVAETMHGPALNEEDVSSIVAYMKSLPRLPRQSKLVDGELIDTEGIARGQEVFRKQACVKCHAGKTKTSERAYDVGLTDSLGTRKFNPPSLRGINHRTRFLHDSRASSLAEVFAKHQHPDGRAIPEQQLNDLIHYLESL